MVTLGRYHLAEAIGGGPTGEVFRATVMGTAGTGRLFAVKVFHPELAGTRAFVERLADAARAYTALEHPGVGRLEELEHAGGRVYASVEWIDGIDLGRLGAAASARGVAVAPHVAVRLILETARVVAHAHARGTVHLGLCPTNVVVTSGGGVKVTDFGFLDARLHARSADDLGARRRYVAPEQCDRAPTGRTADVYGLGAMALDLLTGGSGEPRGREVPSIPSPIEDVLRRAMAPEPRDRFPDAVRFADALERAANESQPAGSRAQVARWVRVVHDRARQDALGAPPMDGTTQARPPYPPSRLDDEIALGSTAAMEVGDAMPRGRARSWGTPAGRLVHVLVGALLGAVVTTAYFRGHERPGGPAPPPTRAAQPAPAPPVSAGLPVRDAGAASSASPAPPPRRPRLAITTVPAGASVYLDGSMKGRTPLELPETGDRHKLALVLPGYRLVRTEIEGGGRVEIPLEPAPTFRGPAGIKVRCTSKFRLYVTVDGVDTGWLCPTERIKVSLGVHTVDIYDPVTDATVSKKVTVEDTHYSVRVRVNL